MNPEHQLKELIQFARDNNLEEVVWEEKGRRIAFRWDPSLGPRNPQASGNGTKAPEVEPPKPSREFTVTSPMVGTFWRATTRDHPPLVVEGEHVEPGDKLAVVEAMKMPSDVVSFSAGRIKKIMVQNGQSVEYGQPLFVLEPLDVPETAPEADV